jgi:hypothetical protein
MRPGKEVTVMLIFLSMHRLRKYTKAVWCPEAKAEEATEEASHF